MQRERKAVVPSAAAVRETHNVESDLGIESVAAAVVDGKVGGTETRLDPSTIDYNCIALDTDGFGEAAAVGTDKDQQALDTLKPGQSLRRFQGVEGK